ncbi:MAG: isoprenylcysteine carboxylmethyltransferase family protein [Cyclobacteriaceae bacterium]|nr:hypothetical protein [Cytophagales bacterium]HNP77670.1 isoprenylcysteine carboxylmethyltransferase family protein [Cyclobacteriaceae bacterium]
MKKIVSFLFSIVAYLIAFAALVIWILSISGLIPVISIDRSPEATFGTALIIDLGLVALFGLHHSLAARAGFKAWLAGFLPRPIERSLYVLTSGLLLLVLVRFWQPLGGTIWSIDQNSSAYWAMYMVSLLGWTIMLVSTFLINHFDLFGLRQTFAELKGKTYEPLEFRVVAFYKYVRHPLYFGLMLGLWATPVMTVTHLVMAFACTDYILIGSTLEEKDLKNTFGNKYLDYQRRVPKFFPFLKTRLNTPVEKEINKQSAT